MAPTSDERREVAARLRELDHEITSYDTIESGANKLEKAVCGNTSFSPIEYSVRNLCGLANTLADLIDPQERTCRIARKGGGAISAGWYVCSECGLVYPPCNDDIAKWALQFCPHCGARITEVVDE